MERGGYCRVAVVVATLLGLAHGEGIIFEFEQASYSVNEGDGLAEVCIVLTSGALSANTPITLTPQTGTASADDLSNTVTPQTVVFPLGSVAGERRCINIPINDDDLVELLESFSVGASSTDPNVEFIPGLDQTVVSITDNDELLLGLQQASYDVLELSISNSVEVCFEVLDGILDINVQPAARLLTQHGSAQDPADFMDIDVNFDLPIRTGLPGSQNIFCENIDIVDDNVAEGTEDFLVLLSSLNGQFVTIDPTASSATVNILDDDGKKV